MSDDPLTPPSRLAKLKQWMRTHPVAAYLIAGVSLILIAGGIAFAILVQKPDPLPVSNASVQPPKPKPIYYSPLTGLKVDNETDTTKPVTAIMIENSPDARPQSGLKQAEVVYEAVAEGGITRFLALYQQNKPKLIGPVRSVRLYYVDWLSAYDASVAHVGGSFKALKLVRGGKYRDIDQFFNPGAYWRATDRYAPHNVYTSFKRLDALNKSKKYTTSNPRIIERADDTAEKVSRNAKKINLSISGPLYNSSYVYDKGTGLYVRSQGGAPHVDREKGRIRARVVIALRVAMETVFEDGYRESIKTSGKGNAVVFQNGHAYKLTWKKKSRTRELQFYDKSGEIFKLARGTTWISAIPSGTGDVSWK